LIETSERLAPLTSELMTRVGLRAEIIRDDELDATVVLGVAETG
jgi:hypothetical protein